MNHGTWLVSAFAPFGGARTNSSLILAEKLRGRPGLEVVAPLPVSFAGAWPELWRHLESRSDLRGVLALGQAESRVRLSVERLALNWVDARMPDNEGLTPKSGPLREGQPELLWSPIAWDRLEPLSAQCERSYSAGTYVCNALMFDLLAWAKSRGLPAGFIHIPLLASQKDIAQPPPDTRLSEAQALAELESLIDFARKGSE